MPGGLHDPEQDAYELALRILTFRARTRAELSERLTAKGTQPGTVNAVLDRLERSGLLDDTATASSYAATRAGRGLSRARIRRDLLARGVDGDVADAAAHDAVPAEDEAGRCEELAATWIARHRGLPADTAARRLAGYLARRGYPSGLVARVVRDLVRSNSDEWDDE